MNKDVPKLWIANDAFIKMCRLATVKFPLETGGMLLGYVANNGESVVTDIIGPGLKAKHGRFNFTPDGEYQQFFLEKHFSETEGRETYLGDWHTHPKGEPYPSHLDRRTLARIAQTPSSGTSHPVMAILGGGNKEWLLGAVQFQSIEKKLIFNYHQVTQLLPVYFSSQGA